MKNPVAEAAPDLAELRNDYALKSLDERDVDADPMKQFGVWMVEAIHAQAPEPTAMTLATASAKGRPAARIVLLKGVDPRGFVFYTNYASRKGRELAANPQAALTFLWKELERQVRIEGSVEKVSAAESNAYYATRPLGSRIGAWASPQSEAIENRAWLEKRWEELGRQHGENPPLPPHWGGYRVIPDYLEFWQGRRSRLHDRIAYTRSGNAWKIARLAP
jgi:pyridoxamine 5'-phosphate oxidase